MVGRGSGDRPGRNIQNGMGKINARIEVGSQREKPPRPPLYLPFLRLRIKQGSEKKNESNQNPKSGNPLSDRGNPVNQPP
jgi:hypothetical protein